MRPIKILFLALTVVAPSLNTVWAEGVDVRVVMHQKSASTFYVNGEISGYGSVELMVDTGSGHMTINEHTLEVLKRDGQVRYVRELRGVLADGSQMVVPVYSIAYMSIGDSCWLQDVEAAVFPGNSRQILGLSALRKAAPFTFSVDPPSLGLSHCGDLPAAEAKVKTKSESGAAQRSPA